MEKKWKRFNICKGQKRQPYDKAHVTGTGMLWFPTVSGHGSHSIDERDLKATAILRKCTVKSNENFVEKELKSRNRINIEPRRIIIITKEM